MSILKKKIAPSLMCADIMELGRELETFRSCGIEYLHVDVMDGVFVPNFTLGTDYISRLQAACNIPLDIHLMISDPSVKLGWFEIRPGDFVSVHYEADSVIQRTLSLIRLAGGKSMVALNPGTPLCVLEELLPDLDGVLIMTVNPGFAGQKLVPQTIDKIARLRHMLDEKGYGNVSIEVDGNVSFENARKMSDAGADIFVGGTSSVFAKGGTVAENVAKLRSVI